MLIIIILCTHTHTHNHYVHITDATEEEKKWDIFTRAVADMRALKLLHFFIEHPVTVVIHDKVITNSNLPYKVTFKNIVFY